jgi:hypothetical protein
MGPLVILGVFSGKPQGSFMIFMSGAALLLFILSQLQLIPSTLGPVRMDLGLMILLSLAALSNFFFLSLHKEARHD